MWDDLPDEAVMEGLARDDPSAFDALFRRHQQAVFNFALRMVGDRGTAEDVAQECFLRVWSARHSYHATAALRTWLFTIARRLALDELKKRRGTLPLLSADEKGGAGQRAGPPEIVEAGELARALDRAVDRLPEELREAVVLRDMEELSYEEIAQVCGCPLGTVKSRLNAARSRLRAVVLEWLRER